MRFDVISAVAAGGRSTRYAGTFTITCSILHFFYVRHIDTMYLTLVYRTPHSIHHFPCINVLEQNHNLFFQICQEYVGPMNKTHPIIN